MKNKLQFKLWLLMSVIIVISLGAKAQSVNGCVLYDASGAPRLSRPMYTGPTTLTINTNCNGNNRQTVAVRSSTPATAPLNTLCYSPALPNVGSNRFRNCAVVTILNGSGIYECGLLQTITIVPCPIDDYVGYLLLSLSVIGIFSIQKINCSVFSSSVV